MHTCSHSLRYPTEPSPAEITADEISVDENCASSLTDLRLVGRKNRRKGIGVHEEAMGGGCVRCCYDQKKGMIKNNSCVFVCVLVKDVAHVLPRMKLLVDPCWSLSALFFLPSPASPPVLFNYLVGRASSPVCLSTWKRRRKRWRWEGGGEGNTWSRGLLLSSSESL